MGFISEAEAFEVLQVAISNYLFCGQHSITTPFLRHPSQGLSSEGIPATREQSGAIAVQLRLWCVFTNVKKIVEGRASDESSTRALMSAI